MKKTLIKNAFVVNEGETKQMDVLIEAGKIAQIKESIAADDQTEIVEAEGKYLLPGLIDDQVHFREPGLTHKACIRTESRAAVDGGPQPAKNLTGSLLLPIKMLSPTIRLCLVEPTTTLRKSKI